ncbi:zinc finger BED domain-containing protein 1-like [Ostrinia furnacalis]|uniref:zinc finger BED domain-containing protein 1-like n=1 Tax=Ostrinia furnacalis TaxID=93504 RepID=UPI0010403175|nr:zinc finger BED domain-containing protein 1-like [Ostrinia furnacalis]
MPTNKKKSLIWNYFQRGVNNKEATCKFCNKTLKTSGNTTNLRGHMEKKHADVVQDCITEEPSQKKLKLNDVTDTTAQSSEPAISHPESTDAVTPLMSVINVDSMDIVNKGASTSSGFEKPQQQPNVGVGQLFTNIKSITSTEGTKNKKITEAILNFIILDHKAFSVVEGKGFLQLLKEVVPLYKVPSRETFKKRVDDKYEVMSGIFKNYIKSAQYYCLTYDIWTETMQNKSFVGVTIHFLEETKLTSGTLGVFELFERHTAEYVQRRLTEILTEWCISIDKVTAIVTDNDSTVMKVNRDMFGEKKIIPCFAHTVNLTIDNPLTRSETASQIIGKVREIVKFIKRSVNASDELRKKQREAGCKEGQTKKLILDVRTRWNSTFYMLERFLELVSTIGAILLCRSDAPPMLTSSEIGCLREIVQLIKPFEKLTKEISGQNYITVSKVIPLISCLRGMLENFSPKFEAAISLKTEIEKEVMKRFDNKLEHNSSLALATALDPRFKLIHFKDAMAKAKVVNYVNNYVKNMQSMISPAESSDESEREEKADRESDIWSYHKQLTHDNLKNKITRKAESEFHMFISSPVNSIKEDPIEIWEDMKTVFPYLYKLAMKHLPIVATSVPSERLFSEAGAVITQERNRLLGSRLSKLLFLNSVMRKNNK